jgi:hypothetical protein
MLYEKSLPDAGRERNGILPTRGYDGHQGRERKKDDPAVVAKNGFEAR